jgi:hypothetical protein
MDARLCTIMEWNCARLVRYFGFLRRPRIVHLEASAYVVHCRPKMAKMDALKLSRRRRRRRPRWREGL